MNTRAALANLKGLVGQQQMLSHKILLYLCLAIDADTEAKEQYLSVARESLLRLRRIYKTVVKGDPDIALPEAVSQRAAEQVDSLMRQPSSVLAKFIREVKQSISQVELSAPCDVSELAVLASTELSSVHVELMNAIQADLDVVAQQAEQQREQTSVIIEQTLNQVQLIASKVKIISLNAAVEAARLGSSGAPIAVIASEVRHLSEESEVAARKIRDTLG